MTHNLRQNLCASFFYCLHCLLDLVSVQSIIAPLCRLDEVADIGTGFSETIRCDWHVNDCMSAALAKFAACLHRLELCCSCQIHEASWYVDLRPALSTSGFGIGLEDHGNDSKTHTHMSDSSGTAEWTLVLLRFYGVRVGFAVVRCFARFTSTQPTMRFVFSAIMRDWLIDHRATHANILH